MKEVMVRDVCIGHGTPKLCVPIVGRTGEEVLEQAAKVAALPLDLIEWRADWLQPEEDAMAVLSALRVAVGTRPLLVTFRTAAEGGERQPTFAEYLTFCRDAAASGCADLLDVELFCREDGAEQVLEAVHRTGVPVVMSSHDFHATPRRKEMFARLQRMQEMGAEIAKLAVMPQSHKDVLRLMDVTLQAKKELECPIITMAMGPLGVVSRMAGEFFGSALTFGAGEQASAPGQMPATALRQVLDAMHASMEG